MASDLARAGSSDEDLIKTLNNMRYVKDTNSIIFTGPSEAVEKARALAEKFDIPGLAQKVPVRSPTGFLMAAPTKPIPPGLPTPKIAAVGAFAEQGGGQDFYRSGLNFFVSRLQKK